MPKIVMYSRSIPCAFVQTARRLFGDLKMDYKEIFIDQDETARKRVLDWTGFASVPTIILAGEDDLPITPPSYLEKGASPRGVDRGTMITEPSREELSLWLQKHGLLTSETA